MNRRKSIIAIAALTLSLPLATAAEKKEKKAKPYPLQTCIVSGEKLGEMGKPKYMEYKGQIYGFCCKPCTKEFQDNPKEFETKLKKLQSQKK